MSAFNNLRCKVSTVRNEVFFLFACFAVEYNNMAALLDFLKSDLTVNLTENSKSLRLSCFEQFLNSRKTLSNVFAAGNTAGAMTGFMGMGMAAGAGGMGGMSAQNLFAMGQQARPDSVDAPQQVSRPAPAPADSWQCSCGATVTGKFCPECGSKKPEPKPAADSWTCSCGATVTGKFCPECGKPFGA